MAQCGADRPVRGLDNGPDNAAGCSRGLDNWLDEPRSVSSADLSCLRLKRDTIVFCLGDWGVLLKQHTIFTKSAFDTNKKTFLFLAQIMSNT